MGARLMAIGAILGVVVTAAILAPPSAAQVRDPGEKSVFSTLRVGQMVEVREDRIGIVVTTYEDPAFKAKMASKIVEMGRDYMAVEYAAPEGDVQMEVRYPVSSITAVTIVKKKSERPGSKKKP
jgi:hypothetical protein